MEWMGEWAGKRHNTNLSMTGTVCAHREFCNDETCNNGLPVSWHYFGWMQIMRKRFHDLPKPTWQQYGAFLAPSSQILASSFVNACQMMCLVKCSCQVVRLSNTRWESHYRLIFRSNERQIKSLTCIFQVLRDALCECIFDMKMRYNPALFVSTAVHRLEPSVSVPISTFCNLTWFCNYVCKQDWSDKCAHSGYRW